MYLRGRCLEASGLFFERMVFVQTLLQVLQVDVAVTLDAPQVRVASEVLGFPDWFFFRPVGNHRCAYLVKARELGVFLLECLQQLADPFVHGLSVRVGEEKPVAFFKPALF